MRDFFYSIFIPHPSNNHRAKILHHQSLVILIAFLFFAAFFFPSGFNPFATKIGALADISTKELLTDTNLERNAKSLKPLAENSQLDTAAENKARDMFAKDYWAHNSPDGTTPWVFISGAGYDYVYAGENLARGFSSAKDVVNAWMASPEHRENLLSPNYRDVGFAVAHGSLSGEETFLVVQELGSKTIVPASPSFPSTPIARKVLGFQLSPKINSLNSMSFSSKLILGLMAVLIGVYLIDIFFMRKKQIPRVSGHSLDHSLFMLTIFAVVVIFGLGQII